MSNNMINQNAFDNLEEVVVNILYNIFENGFFETISQGIDKLIDTKLLICLIIIPIIKQLFKICNVQTNSFTKWFSLGKDYKDKNGIQYIILNKVKEKNYKEFLIKILSLCLELFIIVIHYLIVWYMMSFGIVLLSIHQYVNNVISYWLIWVLLITMFFVFNNKKIIPKVKFILLALLNVIFLMWCAIKMALLTKNTNVFFVIIVVLSVVCTAYVIYLWHTKSKRDYHQNLVLKWIRTIRYGIILCAAINMIVLRGYGLTSELLNVWIVLWSIEYIWNAFLGEYKNVNVEIHSAIGDVITYDKIIQYKDNKIKYTLLNGEQEIIDGDVLKSITYECRRTIFDTEKEVGCVMKNGDEMTFHGYTYINGCWILFYKIVDKRKKVLILRSADVEKIVIKRN